MSTVYGIVKQSGAFISVYSQPGKGTTFKVFLPVAERTGEANEHREIKESSWQGTETFMVVEDEDSVRKLIARCLHQQGYRVLEAQNGFEALRLAQAFPDKIQLLLTDVIMPEMNGKELASQIALARPDTKILFLSGYTDSIVNHGILDAGIAFLHKPFGTKALTQKVREVLDSEARAVELVP